MDPIVIVGAGMAAYSLAREWRKLDPGRPLLILSADAGSAYAKPMLSNAFALNKEAAQLASHSAAQMAAQLNAEIRPFSRVSAIDSVARTVQTGAGKQRYASLVLALGAEPVRLPLGGDAAGQVLSVNHLDDYTLLRERLRQAGPNARVVILGAGLIGCEFADDLAGAGHHVTLVDPNVRPLAALAAPALSDGLRAAWAGRSIALRLGSSASAVDADNASGALRVTLAGGEQLDADLVLSAVGLRPAVQLAQQAGLATGRGILVDRYGQTSAPHLYALGDCAEYAGAGVQPYVAPLLAAARAIAATLAGRPTPIALKTEAVLVKTPSYRMALAPPPPGLAGSWSASSDGERTVARYLDADGALRGFGLSQPTPALRQQLLAALQS